MKSYTNLEQSRKLAEILPLETADAFYAPDAGVIITEPYITVLNGEKNIPSYKEAVPCWSLVTLLSVLPLPSLIQDKADEQLFWQCCVYDEDGTLLCETNDNNPVDACYEMIMRLHELNLL